MRGIEHLHPATKAKAEKLLQLCKDKNIPILITETYRTKQEQDALYAKGRTASGSVVTNARYPDSPHCWGVAFDFCKNVVGQEYSDTAFFNAVGSLGKTLGLFWGGDYKSFKDRPHFEDKEFVINNSVSSLKAKYGTPDAFKKTWKEDKPMTLDEALKVLKEKSILNSPEHWKKACEVVMYLEKLLINMATKLS